MQTAIVLTLLVLGAHSCEEEINFGYSTCDFYVHSLNESCLDFSFLKCTWTECATHYYDLTGEHCLSYGTSEDTSWDSCTNRCCEGGVNYMKTYASIAQCQEYINNRVQLIIAVVFSVVGVVIIIGSIWCYCSGRCCNCLYDCLKNIRKCCACVFCCCFFRSRPKEEEPKPEADNPSRQIINIPLEQKWRFQNLNNTKLNNVCSVCLDERPSLQLQCGHVFHRKCILACLKKKHECILCRATDIDRVNVYCEQCFSAYFQGNLRDLKSSLSSMNQVCNGCHEAGNL